MSPEEAAKFEELVETDSVQRAASGEQMGKKIREQDEYDSQKLY